MTYSGQILKNFVSQSSDRSRAKVNCRALGQPMFPTCEHKLLSPYAPVSKVGLGRGKLGRRGVLSM